MRGNRVFPNFTHFAVPVHSVNIMALSLTKKVGDLDSSVVVTKEESEATAKVYCQMYRDMAIYKVERLTHSFYMKSAVVSSALIQEEKTTYIGTSQLTNTQKNMIRDSQK